MGVRIFVEDRLTEAYEVLALRALNLPLVPRNRTLVLASRVEPEDLTSLDGLCYLARGAVSTGYDCVLFVLDREDPLRSRERPALLARFRQAFDELCAHQRTLRAEDPLRRAKIVRILCECCLEGWLLADPQAVVDAVRGSLGVDYRPAARRTDNFTPAQAGERIAHIIGEVGKRLQRGDLRRVNLRNVKSRGKSIAERLDPGRARQFNASLDYFLSMVDGRRSGCEHPGPF